MRLLVSGLAVAALAACAQSSPPATGLGPPPLEASDFMLPTSATELGDWATRDPATLSAEFQAMMEERYLLYTVDQAVADLESFGHDCLVDRGHGASCTSEVWNRACGHTWSVRLEPVSVSGAIIETVDARFSKACVGGR